MTNTIKSTLALGLVVAAAVLTSTADAEIHSRSKELVVMEARDLPEQAQTPGNSLFLHSDNAGSTYLYVEQQQGARLSVFDVTFRDSQKEAVLDLRKTKRPVLRMISTVTDLGPAVALGESGFLVTSQAHKYAPAVARDYQVIDVAASIPTQLATVNDVKHRVTNDYTGTTFLLGPNGLTVVRRLSVENDYKVHQMQMQGN